LFFHRFVLIGRKALLILNALFLILPVVPGQSPVPAPGGKSPGSQRLTFADAQRLLEGEAEGNVSRRPESYSRTRLRNGQILELFYPLKFNSTRSATRASRASKAASVPGFGLLYASEAVYSEAHRPRHILEELLPDGQSFVAQVPQLVANLEKRLRAGNGRLDYSRVSLKRVDAYLVGYRRAHTTADNDPALFQEISAYYGEVLKHELGGEWRTHGENIAQKRVQQVPNVVFKAGSVSRELKPWSSVLDVLYNEDQRGLTLTAACTADLTAARR